MKSKIVKFFSILPVTPPIRGYLYKLFVQGSGSKYGKNFRIGFGSYIDADQIVIGDNVHIDNLVRMKFLDKFRIGEDSSIGSSTIVCGAMRKNKVSKQNFEIGEHTNILCSHYFDVVSPISIGNYVTIGGKWSQFYTHSFDLVGNRLDGEIKIGDHVYIGAGCIINLGVDVGNRIVLSAGTCLNQSVKEEGVYASNTFVRRGDVREYGELYSADNQYVELPNGKSVYKKVDNC